jgi:hypothetical protein
MEISGCEPKRCTPYCSSIGKSAFVANLKDSPADSRGLSRRTMWI